MCTTNGIFIQGEAGNGKVQNGHRLEAAFRRRITSYLSFQHLAGNQLMDAHSNLNQYLFYCL